MFRRTSTAYLVALAILGSFTRATAQQPKTASGEGKAGAAEVPWGEWNDGLSMRLRPDKIVWAAGETLGFTLDIRRKATKEDKGQRDLMLNLGIIARGGHYPKAVRLVLTDSARKAREFEVIGPPTVSREDDFVVPVASGSTYTRRLPLADFWLPTKGPRLNELPPGEYRIHAVLEGKALQHVSAEMRGIKSMTVWEGTLTSAPVTISATPPRAVPDVVPAERKGSHGTPIPSPPSS